MNSPEQPPGRKPNPILDLGILVAGQVGFSVVFIVLAAAFGGIWLDKTFSTKPLFTILLVVGSGPVCLYVVYRLAMAALAKIPPPPGKIGRGDYRDEGGNDE